MVCRARVAPQSTSSLAYRSLAPQIWAASEPRRIRINQPPRASRTRRIRMFEPPKASEHVKYVQMRLPKPPGHVKHLQVSLPEPPGHVKYAQMSFTEPPGHVEYIQINSLEPPGHNEASKRPKIRTNQPSSASRTRTIHADEPQNLQDTYNAFLVACEIAGGPAAGGRSPLNMMVRTPEFQLAMCSRPSLAAVFRWPSLWVFAQIPSEHPGVCLR